MSRKNSSKTNNSSTTRKRKGPIIALGALFLVVVVALVAAIGSRGFTLKSVKTWFNGWGHGVIADSENKGPDEDENTFHTSTSEDNVFVAAEGQGLMLLTEAVPVEEYDNYGISPLSAENVFNLSVTYNPSNATFQQTDYTIKFANVNSAWASGKSLSDYAEIQHTAGSKNATLIVKKPFGEKIIITAVSQRDSSLTATFTVDYLKNFTFKTSNTLYDVDIGDDLYFTQSPIVWSDGTLTPEIDGGQIKIVFDLGADFVAAMQARGITADRYVYDNLYPEDFSGEDSLQSFHGYMVDACDCSSDTARAAIKDAYTWLIDESNDWHYGFMYNRVYDGVTYSGGVSDIEDIDWITINLCGTYLHVPASSMTPNGSHIIAG